MFLVIDEIKKKDSEHPDYEPEWFTELKKFYKKYREEIEGSEKNGEHKDTVQTEKS